MKCDRLVRVFVRVTTTYAVAHGKVYTTPATTDFKRRPREQLPTLCGGGGGGPTDTKSEFLWEVSKKKDNFQIIVNQKKVMLHMQISAFFDYGHYLFPKVFGQMLPRLFDQQMSQNS